jgi:hypothetical protein
LLAALACCGAILHAWCHCTSYLLLQLGMLLMQEADPLLLLLLVLLLLLLLSKTPTSIIKSQKCSGNV